MTNNPKPGTDAIADIGPGRTDLRVPVWRAENLVSASAVSNNREVVLLEDYLRLLAVYREIERDLMRSIGNNEVLRQQVADLREGRS